MTWGNAARELHDALDEIIEDQGSEYLNVITAAHQGESAEEVARLLINAASPNEVNLRCSVGYEQSFEKIDILLDAINASINLLKREKIGHEGVSHDSKRA
jgi:hypothetical protein